MLEVEDLHAFYGSSHVVQGVSFSIQHGEAVALMGRNGVGKTSTLKSIMGLDTRTQGEVRFDGTSMNGLPPHARAARGLGYVPEERAVFPEMTVEENIRIGALAQSGSNQRECLARAYTLFPVLRERRQQMAGTLSGGQQKMLALARAIALRPKLLMVDEPSEGLMPANVELITKLIDFGDRIAFFYGTLSDLEYTLRVQDTVGGTARTYHNVGGTFCGGLDNHAF